MSKSKYPKQIDSSIELPVVRDNITQISSELFNSLRSAIIQIEKTLGIDPNGIDANTVSDRLSKSLDELGNIKKEAISALNLISGPILNKDVADNARIHETKLDLNYSTDMLYSQALSVKADLNSLIGAINDLALKLSIHLNKESLSQHNAIQIDLQANTTAVSSVATNSLTAQSLQATIEDLYNRHINLNPIAITENNNAHTASQIYFNSDNLSITSTNVQGAIEEVSGEFGESLSDQFFALNANGRIRFANTSNPQDSDEYFELVSSAAVSFSLNQTQETEIDFQSPQTVLSDISKFDIVELSSSLSSYKQYFKINTYSLNGSGQITSFKIFGSPEVIDDNNYLCRILKNNNQVLNLNGLNACVKPSFGRSSSPYIILSNPNSATVISYFCIPSKISASLKDLTVEIDGTSYVFDVYNSALSIQTLDSIIYKINEQTIDNNIPLSAFKIKRPHGFELSLSHAVPNLSGDTLDRTLKVVSGGAADALGFTKYVDKVYYGSGKNSFFIKGKLIENPIKSITLTGSEVAHSIGSNNLTVTSKNLLELGVKRGDLIYIQSSSASDTGIQIISSVTATTITFDNSSFSFSTNAISTDQYFILKNGASLADLSLENVSGLNAFMLVDGIYIKDKFFLSKRIEFDYSNTNPGFEVILTNVSRDFIVAGETAKLTISTSLIPTFVDTLGNSITGTAISSNGFKKIYSADNLSFIEIYVSGYSSTLSLATQIVINMFGFDEAPEEVYLVSRSTYSYNLGFILNSDSGEGVPAIVDKRLSGTIKSHNVSDEFFEKIIEGPRHELRGNGIVSGCNVSNVSVASSVYTFDISSGVYFVNGIRKEFLGVQSFQFDLSGETFSGLGDYIYIYFNKHGEISYSFNPGTNSNLYYENTFLAIYNATILTLYDIRLFINQFDKKLISNITVGNNIQHCHFTDFNKAVNYSFWVNQISGVTSKILIQEDMTITSNISLYSALYKGLIIDGQKNTLYFGMPGQPTVSSDTALEKTTSCMFSINEAASVTFKNISFDISNESSTGNMAFISRAGSFNTVGGIHINNCRFYSTGLDRASNKVRIPFILQNTVSPSSNTIKPNSSFNSVGNIIISDNYFVQSGNEKGLIFAMVKGSSVLPIKQVVISNNILSVSSPNDNTTAANYNIFMITDNLVSGSHITTGTIQGLSVTGNSYDP